MNTSIKKLAQNKKKIQIKKKRKKNQLKSKHVIMTSLQPWFQTHIVHAVNANTRCQACHSYRNIGNLIKKRLFKHLPTII